ncbi:maleylpyruvate isomerase family mycothiol-dependent enzyme [Nocardia cyriacigeorgica]|uniref:maleylpyruvate isomerase family mycothiol-dependent enzyme n=1 Tax=Nocardia cyriacigeorgica TaxID=135487 RepID=UPI001893B14B|nr:maleylpyruvate isomerase family mycothiol-dependent enzyme [Nocardia cyriacigeorgica]MBF6092366.1 maleylpyruvate isomerase family mycothiol-dependent enzyme [Nocardia cyriacigeorgica]
MTSQSHEAALELLDIVTESTRRLLATIDSLDDAALKEPSLLPGWTRGHVLAHLSRNADSLVNLLLWARTGVEIPQYASAFLRESDIEEGAPRPLAEQRTDFVESAQRFAGLAATLSPEQWQAEVRTRQGRPIPATEVVWMRWQEVEIHHVDLAADYTHTDWPADFVGRLLPEAAASLSKSATEPFEIITPDFTATIGEGTPTNTITAPAADTLVWLLGRTTPASLPQPLPPVPDWK